jgi:hypothetical protein
MNLTRKFNPPFLALIGDLVDSRNGSSFLSWHQQWEENWRRYNATRVFGQVFAEDRTVFELAGNHDMYLVGGDNEIQNKYRHYVLKPGETFSVRSVYYPHNFSVPVNVILSNTERPPTTSGPAGIFPSTRSADLEALDAHLIDGIPNIVFSHFPFSHVWGISNVSVGRGPREIAHRSHLYVGGHTHPPYNEIARKTETLSMILTAFFEQSLFAFAFVDSGGPGIQVMDTADERSILVTYPLPKSQLTSRSVFNLRSFPVRAIGFTDLPATLSVYIDGGYEGVLQFVRTLRRNVQLYSLDVKVARGDHILQIGEYKMTFFVGDETEETSEYADNLETPDSCLWAATLFGGLALLYVIPWWNAMPEVLENYRLNIIGAPGAIPLSTLELAFLGPLYTVGRLRRAPTGVYVWCCVMAFGFLACPMYVTWVDQDLALAWMWGLLLKGEMTRDAILYVVWFVYLIFFALETFVLVGAWCEVEPEDTFGCGQKIEVGILLFVMVAGGIIGGGLILWHAGMLFTLLTAPLLWVEVITLVILFVSS